MPADYSSTARALALPVSPPRSPAVKNQPRQLPWTRQSSQPTIATISSHRRTKASLRDQVVDNAERLQRQFFKSMKKLTLAQRILGIIAFAGFTVLGILFLVFNEKIFAWLEPLAEKWENLRGGWLILWAMIFTTAFPPVIGYSTCMTISGFVFGFPNG